MCMCMCMCVCVCACVCGVRLHACSRVFRRLHVLYLNRVVSCGRFFDLVLIASHCTCSLPLLFCAHCVWSSALTPSGLLNTSVNASAHCAPCVPACCFSLWILATARYTSYEKYTVAAVRVPKPAAPAAFALSLPDHMSTAHVPSAESTPVLLDACRPSQSNDPAWRCPRSGCSHPAHAAVREVSALCDTVVHDLLV
jgi:hypothetical protein